MKNLTKLTIIQRTTTHHTSIPTAMPSTVLRLIDMKPHQHMSITRQPIIITRASRTHQVMPQYKIHFIRITRKITRIRTIIIITTRIKTTD